MSLELIGFCLDLLENHLPMSSSSSFSMVSVLVDSVMERLGTSFQERFHTQSAI